MGNTANIPMRVLQVSQRANLPIFSPRTFFSSSASTSPLLPPTIRPLMDGESVRGAATTDSRWRFSKGVEGSMRKMLVLGLLLCSTAVANNLPYYGTVWQNAQTDQARCEAEARYMAARGIRGHVGPNIGNFEGVGWGFSSRPATCTPGRAMRLTGDAVAQSANGTWYRVRSWR